MRIDNIRKIKKDILQTSFIEKERFIIFDDVDLFNVNSLNALLKIIEEPEKNNHFILINNNSKPIIATVKSRCLEINIILNEFQRVKL